MRSSRKKRIIAIVLCMVLALGGGAPSLLFDSFQADEISSEDTTSAVQSETATSEEAPAAEVTEPAAAEPEVSEPVATETPVVTEEPAVEEVAAPHQDEMELKQEMKDAEGNVYCTVTAKIPTETFAANTADVTMEVSTVDDQVTADTIKSLMEKNLAADKQLGSYFLYNVTFKVSGQITEATKPIEITFEQSNFQIGDVKKASTIYYNEANSTAGNVEPEIITIAQRDDKIEELQKAGLSLDTMDNDYDLSQITLNEDGTVKKIMVEGRRSTIYGCYLAEDKPTESTTTDETKKDETKTEESGSNLITETVTPEDEAAEKKKAEKDLVEAEALKYEDNDVTVTVSANEKGIIPEGVTLQVIPILPETQSSVTETSTIAVPEEKEPTTLLEANKSTEANVVTPASSASEYEKVKTQLEEKAANEDYDIAGFLAYDISFIDKDGNKVEPNGNVKVVIDYKQEAIPDGIETTEDTSVTVMHLEEDGNGQVKDVVDMVADPNKEATVDTNQKTEIKKAEFVTDSFSTFTITWMMASVVSEQAEPEVLSNNDYYTIRWNCTNSSAGIKEFRLKIVDVKGNVLTNPEWQSLIELNAGGKTEYSISALLSAIGINENVHFTTSDGIASSYRYSKNYVQCASDSSIQKSVGSLAIWKNDTVPYIDNTGITEKGTVTVRGKNGDLSQQSALKDEDVLYLVFGAENTDIQYTCLTENGSELQAEQSYTIPVTNKVEMTADELARTVGVNTFTKEGTDYLISKMYVQYTDAQGSLQKREISSLKVVNDETGSDFQGNTWQKGNYFIRVKCDGTSKVITENDQIILTYKALDDLGLTTVDTVDLTGTGINVQMFDYASAAALGAGAYTADGHTGNIKSGILANKILDGAEFPTIAKGNKSGTDISQWFTNGTNVNHLFLQDTLDQTGYYYYSSLDNYAMLKNDGNFVVFDAIGTPDNSNKYFYQRGNFMPYNQISAGQISANKSLYDEYGHKLEGPSRTLYKTQGTNDYYFGMYMNANFYQAEDGKFNGDDMIYEFNGDDDLWVYIDGVLVLDIGGIHDSQSGSINFANGTVTISDCDSNGVPVETETNLKALFEAANVSTEDFTGNTFSDYSSHKIQMFYMERGAGASTLKMKMNLPVIPEGTVKVAKTLGNTDQGKYANVEFQFKMHLIDEYDNDTVYTPTGENAATLEDGTVISFDDNGVFKLKPGQIATFPNLAITQKYYVEEIGVDPDNYNKVEINQTQIIHDTGEITNGVKSTTTTVQQSQAVNFKNYITDNNKSNLKLVKKLAEGQTSEENYEFNVWLEGTDGTLIPYVGKYLIGLETGNENELVEYSTDNGKISIRQNQQVLIKDLVVGTDFLVTETSLDAERYQEPEKVVTNEGTRDIDTADGKVLKDETAIVTITNTKTTNKDNPFINVQKTFEGLTDPKTQASNFAIKLYGDSACAELKATLSLKDNNVVETKNTDGTITYTWRIDNLKAGTYYVKEENEAVTGYGVEIRVNGKIVTSGSVTEVHTQEPTYEFEGGFRANPCNLCINPFGGANYIAGSKGSNSFFVWTEQPLSDGEREAFVKAILPAKGTFSSMTVDTTVFYSSIDTLKGTIVFDTGTMKVIGDSIENYQLELSQKDVWSQLAIGNYHQTDAVNAEIEVYNKYTETPATVQIKKYDSAYGKQIDGAVFELYKGIIEDGNSTISWGKDPIDTITVKGTIAKELTSGYYKLVETVAPSGYIKLPDDQPILFKVVRDNGSGSQSRVNLINESGGMISSTAPSMWKLEGTGDRATVSLCIKNEVIYSLPSAGGIGIYWYMIGGVLLMLAAALILYRNKQYEGGLKK